MADEWTPKHPRSVVDYGYNWRTDYLEDGETIAESSARILNAAESGVTIDSQNLTSEVHIVWLSGGTPGKVAHVEFKVVTSAGRTDYRTVPLEIKKL